MRWMLCLFLLAAGTVATAEPLPQLVGSIAGADGGWDYAFVDSDRQQLYVARADGVMAINLKDQVVTNRLVPGQRVHGVISLPGGLGLAANGDSKSAMLFTTADGAVQAEFPAGKKADAVVRDPRSGLAAVMNSNDGTVSVIDVTQKKPAGLFTVGGTLEFAVADGAGHVFVNIEDQNQMAVLDLKAGAVTARYALAPCDSPTGLALDDARHILLAACGNGMAVALSALDGHLLATLPIGKGPDAVLFDARRRRFLVPCGRDGVLTVIDESAAGALSVAGSVATAPGARTGAVDPDSGRSYLPTADFAPAKPGERPAALPGTFRILVLQ
jgi:hypothetical protein